MEKNLQRRRILFRGIFLIILWGLVACGSGNSTLTSQGGDGDGDGLFDSSDNCPTIFNPSQVDENQNGIGDLCEPIVGCGDGICDPEGGECDVFNYCLKDCTRSRCFGLPDNVTCGDGRCDPLAGECSDSGPCIKDCPDPDMCFPGTCGNNVCEPWERDTGQEVTFCPNDCACQVNLVEGDCQTILDCADTPGTVCQPTSLPQSAESFQDFVNQLVQIPCHCTSCGNGILEAEEACDFSAGEAGVKSCFDSGGACDGTTCECIGGQLCPNARLDPGEECDTGLVLPPQQGTCQPGFVCDAEQCACSQCGNGVVDGGEQCDTGGVIDSSPDCDALGTGFVCRHNCICSKCGNGSIDPGEDCDVNGPSLPAACQAIGFCPSDCVCGPPSSPEVCDNCADDDVDTLFDCGDPDCSGASFCQSSTTETCRGCLDDDGDGLIDCADPDCASKPACNPPACACPENVAFGFCGDNLDNDGNSLTDCADPACASDPACP